MTIRRRLRVGGRVWGANTGCGQYNERDDFKPGSRAFSYVMIAPGARTLSLPAALHKGKW